MLAKCWRRVQGKIVLYKAGSTGAANAGNEPYSEFYACQIARAMGLDAVAYSLHRWQGRLCSTCELFTDKTHAYIPTGRLVTEGLCVAFAPAVIGISIMLLLALSLFRGDRARMLRLVLLQSIIIIAVARLCLPISSMISLHIPIWLR